MAAGATASILTAQRLLRIRLTQTPIQQDGGNRRRPTPPRLVEAQCAAPATSPHDNHEQRLDHGISDPTR
jgi:hypothetical protein